jgi:tRNA-specific 2-thiouridylase
VDDESDAPLGTVPAVELVTLGQRRGLGDGGDGRRRYVVGVDVQAAEVRLAAEPPMVAELEVHGMAWVDQPVAPGTAVLTQCSAHGHAVPATVVSTRGGGEIAVRFAQPQRAVAAGQSVVLYHGDAVLGGGMAA